jgi:hypothetical protein
MLEFALRSGMRALHLVLGGGGLPKDVYLADFHARQFPMGDRHLFHVELLGPGLGMPFGLQIVAELMKLLAVFAGQNDAAGAKAVTNCGRIAAIGLDLLECCHLPL